MAGGKHAEEVPCLVCLSDKGVLTKATRTYEGDETDEYLCEKKHSFGMDWSAGEADSPLWPPDEDLEQFAERKHARRKAKKKAKAQGA